MIEAEDGKSSPRKAFLRAIRCAYLVGACAFWCQVERIAQPEEQTRMHARGILRSMAESAFRDCGGVALSPQQAEAFRYCGLKPVRIAEPGE
jgi:hypothetical protein